MRRVKSEPGISVSALPSGRQKSSTGTCSTGEYLRFVKERGKWVNKPAER